MSRKPLVITVVVLVLAGAGYWFYKRAAADTGTEYRFAEIARGDVEAAVSATGALGAVTTVQVGTQVSGQVSDIYVDFNDHVTKGQLIARIDPILQEQAVKDAEANLDRARAELNRSQLEFERNKRLFESKVLTEVEFNSARYSYQVAQANIKSSEISLQRARQNLEYTSIFSPIDGIVVERNVDAGQTVAASYSTPQLFLIAQDLAKMQILASVDESDIGRIESGQVVRFSVQAYPEQRFQGEVEQVRLQSATQENVVNYTVVVGVSNPDGTLLPGMTATLEFLTGTATDVLLVPNAALRFRPPEAMMAQMREQMQARMRERAQGTGNAAGGNAGAGDAAMPGARNGGGGFGSGGGGFGRGGFGGGMGGGSSDFGRLWYLDEAGKLTILPVRTGISDGQNTEITGRDIEEGMQVVVGVTQQEVSSQQGPFQPQGRGNRRRGGMF